MEGARLAPGMANSRQSWATAVPPKTLSVTMLPFDYSQGGMNRFVVDDHRNTIDGHTDNITDGHSEPNLVDTRPFPRAPAQTAFVEGGASETRMSNASCVIYIRVK